MRRARAESEPRAIEDVRNRGKAPRVHSREREGGSSRAADDAERAPGGNAALGAMPH